MNLKLDFLRKKMNSILKNITLTFSTLNIFPDSNIKLKIKCNSYEEVQIRIEDNLYFILKNGFYPEIIEEVGLYFTSFKKNGKLHRIDEPALICIENDKIFFKEYYHDGKLHRIDGPAIIEYRDERIIFEYYYREGKLHRIDEPAIIEYKDENMVARKYYENGRKKK